MKFAAIFVLFANAFSAGMMFLASVFISRYGGKDLFGFFSVVLGVVVVGAKVTTLGLDVAIVRFLPKYSAEGRGDAAGGIKRLAIGLTLVLSLIGALAFGLMLTYLRGLPLAGINFCGLCIADRGFVSGFPEYHSRRRKCFKGCCR